MLDITDRNKDYKLVKERIDITEVGIRSICVMYDEHSSDINSKKNIYNLKDNIYYRLKASTNQYYLLLEQLLRAEHRLLEIFKKDHTELTKYISTNPYFEEIEEVILSLIHI